MRVLYGFTQHQYRSAWKLKELRSFCLKNHIHIGYCSESQIGKPNSLLVEDSVCLFIQALSPLCWWLPFLSWAFEIQFYVILRSDWDLNLHSRPLLIMTSLVTLQLEVTRVAMTKQIGFARRGFCIWVCVSSVSLAFRADETDPSDSLEITVK